MTISPQLQRLADAHGVATEYQDQLKRAIRIAPQSVVAVLGALGIDATSTAAIEQSLRDAAEVATAAPPVVVLRESEQVEVPIPTRNVRGLVTESGEHVPRRLIDAPVTLIVGARLGLGYHTLHTTDGDVTVIVAPDRLPAPRRQWGLAVQLYAMRSRQSWGIGDLGDLGELADWTGRQGGDLVLVNPLHASAPTTPVQDSPYYPASRRWCSPLYLRVEDTSAYAAAGAPVRSAVDALRVGNGNELIDRNEVWRAKLAALQLLFDDAAPDADVDALDPSLRDWATWCALAEVHGPDWRTWPVPLRRPHAAAVEQARTDLAPRVAFHAWLQQLCAEQLARVHDDASTAGIGIGVVHDLAVGTDPAGADAWALQDALALGARIGAPPDSFNQQGQDWGMPPWHPQRLAELRYLPLRDMLRGLLVHAGGVRIDHVLGLFRMWWVPEDGTARDGTYVRYDADALLSVVTLEAVRAGAVVIGEDLGTVTPVVRRELAGRGILGTSVLWYEREDPVDGKPGALRSLSTWRDNAAASVTTHDLPTALGWLRGEHVRLRAELGLLDDPVAEEKSWAEQRAELVEHLRAAGLVGDMPTDDELVVALHLAVASTPSRVVLIAPGDVIGDVRQPNLPGTTDQYPSWRLPVADEDGRQIPLDELLGDPRLLGLAERLRATVR